MNDAMSMGIHRIWKDIFIQRLHPTAGTKLLDVAGGTGDIAFRYINFIKKLPHNPNLPKSSVTVFDINQNMLDVGMERAKKYRFLTFFENNK
jgi:2-methoxy-6-polyprenyl-1,4-benzoquinol methylase